MGGVFRKHVWKQSPHPIMHSSLVYSKLKVVCDSMPELVVFIGEKYQDELNFEVM